MTNYKGAVPWHEDRALLPIVPEPWTQEGLCVTEPEDLWFADLGTPEEQAAKRTCEECPVALLCFLAAQERGEEFGVWGGVQFEVPEEAPVEMCKQGLHPVIPENILPRFVGDRVVKSCKPCRQDTKNRSRDKAREA